MSVTGKKRRLIRALLIDLDDTLYRNEEVSATVRKAIHHYMLEQLHIAEVDTAANLMSTLYNRYGTTLAGLVASGYTIDFDEWHKAVHYGVLDYDALLQPDMSLRELLRSIPDIPKYILTNADKTHTRICLDRLGIADCFQDIFHFEWAMDRGAAQGLLTAEHPVLCKPSHAIYKLALEEIGCKPGEVIFFDDSARNIQGAHELGMHTCVVGRNSLVPGADLALLTMHDLPSVLPELIDRPDRPDILEEDSSPAAYSVTADAAVNAKTAAMEALSRSLSAAAAEEHHKLDEEATTAPLILVAHGRGSCDGV